MSGFKLIAIRPLKGCSKRFLKVLKEDEVYKFYNDYHFKFVDNDETKSVESIEYIPTVPDGLYNLTTANGDNLNVNISAIVGKNGSGKSSLIDLLFVSVYLLALELEILKRHDIKDGHNTSGIDKEEERIKKRLRGLEDDKKKLLSELESDYTEELIKKLIKNKEIITWQEEEKEMLSNLRVEIKTLRKEVKVEIFYQIENNIFLLKIDSKEKEAIKLEIIPFESSTDNDEIIELRKNKKRIFDDKKIFDKSTKGKKAFADYFFYSLVLNYSQYALNSKEVGNWITELFHKNDGYQTPIVINPMRTDGNFDINTENDLVKQRLLVNIFTPLEGNDKPEESLRHLAQNHIAYRVRINLNENKFRTGLKNVNDYPEVWQTIEKKLLANKRKETTEWDEYAKDYIIGKLISMAKKYPPYFDYYNDNKFDNLDEYLEALIIDNSHIAYKFHQAINFLKYDYANDYYKGRQSITVDELANKLKRETEDKKEKGVSLMHVIPPSFLNVNVLFDKEVPINNVETNTLQNLSSGEKQYIYSISSIMYHLRYIDSVDDTKPGIEYKYKYINLVFDEIELYYHPELQRQFVFDFRNALDRCKLMCIKNINCTFITHSPFILSDIPTSNTLRLNDVVPQSGKDSENTFGANIHKLLANDFFMKDGFMGEFAKNKIEETILFLNLVKLKQQKEHLEEVKRKNNSDKLKKETQVIKKKIKELSIKDINEDRGYHKSIIEQIGEPVIKNKLQQMYRDVFEDEKKKQFEALAEELNAKFEYKN